MKITKSQLQQIIKEALNEEMGTNDPLELLAQADMLAQELADAGEDRGAQISAILKRISSSMNYKSWEQMSTHMGGQE